jgi:hypothetical protein
MSAAFPAGMPGIGDMSDAAGPTSSAAIPGQVANQAGKQARQPKM